MAQIYAAIDTSASFVMRKRYESTNPAMSEVRAPVVAGFWILLALTFIILVYGWAVPIDSAVLSKGSIVPYSNKKTVQHLEGGIIQEILVKDGDRVSAGQKLVILKDTGPAANQKTFQDEYLTARITEARLIAARDGTDEITFDPDLTEATQAEGSAEILATQQRIFRSEHDEQAAKVAVLTQRVQESKAEIDGLNARITGGTDQEALLDREIGSVQILLDKGYATETRLLALQRNKSEVSSSKGEFQAQLGKAQQAVAESEMAIIDEQKEYESKTLHDLHDAQTQISEFREKLRSVTDVVDRTTITAPTEGIVMGLKFHSPGGVVAPGTSIMEIVPQDEPLIVEVHVKPTDISHVRVGLPARIVFTSYKARSTPKIPGKVTQVSADVLQDEHTPASTPYYSVRIEVDKDFIAKLNKPIELYPGLPVDVFIRTGERPFLNYLFRPIVDSMHGAFREE
jgi:HlyD family secretion protein